MNSFEVCDLVSNQSDQFDKNGRLEEVFVAQKDLPCDVKRILRIQWKEFIHYIEDAEVLPSFILHKTHHAA